MTPPAPLEREELGPQELDREALGREAPIPEDLRRGEFPAVPWTPRSIHRRRAYAARARRRRLLVVDLALGLAVALVAVLVGPGLAIVALGALVVLGVCGASLLYGRVVRRRRVRRAGGG
jgi:Flp pilus assembly protein TadB